MTNNIWGTVPEVKAFMDGLTSRESELSVILVGSVARKADTENSDVDLLLISRGSLNDLNIPRRVHAMRSTPESFLEQLEAGEDFEAWCVRFGIVVSDNGLWSQILERPETQIWPSWRKKVMHGARRLILAGRLIATGDLDAAAEEMLYATGHIARGFLLRANIFPLSRPELEEQIRTLGYPHLASIHHELRTKGKHELRFLKRCQAYSKRLLVHLSAQDYGGLAKKYAERKRIKKNARDTKTTRARASRGAD